MVLPANNNKDWAAAAKRTTDIDEFMFPVIEQPVRLFIGDEFDDIPEGLMDSLITSPNMIPNDFRAIVRQDTNELISIVKPSYKMVTNEQLINSAIEELNSTDVLWCLSDSHNMLTNERMKLHIEFPELVWNDGESDITQSMYIFNSYDGSASVQMLFGGIRGICTNGMVFGKVLSKLYHKHTQGFYLSTLADRVRDIKNYIPELKERSEILQKTDPTLKDIEKMKKEFGDKFADEMIQRSELPMTMWQLYMVATWMISHQIKANMVTHYQKAASKVFGM